MRRDANGPLQLFVTRVNLRPENSEVRWKLRLATAEYSVLKATTVTAISKKENAVVAAQNSNLPRLLLHLTVGGLQSLI